MTGSPSRVCWKRGDTQVALRTREWLVTNGLGGYASGTLAGIATRRFHGALVAALPAPHGRTMVLNDVTEDALVGDRPFDLGSCATLEEMRLELGLPVWVYEHDGTRIEKRVLMPHGHNTTYLSYRIARASKPVTVRLRPWFHMRPHEGLLAKPPTSEVALHIVGDGCEVENAEFGGLRLSVAGAPSRFVIDGGTFREIDLTIEKERGYDSLERLFCPGCYEAVIAPGEEAALVASIEPWQRVRALPLGEARGAETERRRRLLFDAGPRLRAEAGAELVLAADQFVVSPRTRQADTARAQATGHDACTIIAGYPWFTDWGRDTMISLEGLTLVTGRRADAEATLRLFARHVKDGLLPNLFPEGGSEGLYHTADATMWFFHAVHRYVATTGDRETLAHVLPILEDIITYHLRGTRFGIGVDPNDGLLRQGADGYQLTWMDAKVGDWVVTPRRGKAVEINALYYNALVLLEGWVRDAGRGSAADVLAGHAARTRASFNERFWYAKGGHLYDVVDGPAGDDASLRPNQIFAISLDHPILDASRWPAVLETVERTLLTPVGLRSLAPEHADYKAMYDGDLRARDAAYHQGTVWSWLIGPFLDAHSKTKPDDTRGRAHTLDGLIRHLGEGCVGSVSEIFDAEPPYAPRGCVAQAWSVAEVLRWLARLETF